MWRDGAAPGVCNWAWSESRKHFRHGAENNSRHPWRAPVPYSCTVATQRKTIAALPRAHLAFQPFTPLVFGRQLRLNGSFVPLNFRSRARAPRCVERDEVELFMARPTHTSNPRTSFAARGSSNACGSMK